MRGARRVLTPEEIAIERAAYLPRRIARAAAPHSGFADDHLCGPDCPGWPRKGTCRVLVESAAHGADLLVPCSLPLPCARHRRARR